MSVHTGNGATLTFGGTAVAGTIVSITSPTLTRAVVDISDLASSDNMESIQGDLTDWSEIEVTFNFDDEADVPDITTAAASTVLTWPLGGHSTAANLTGTGFYTECKYPDFENDSVQQASCKIKFDGQTGPTFTAATDA